MRYMNLIYGIHFIGCIFFTSSHMQYCTFNCVSPHALPLPLPFLLLPDGMAYQGFNGADVRIQYVRIHSASPVSSQDQASRIPGLGSRALQYLRLVYRLGSRLQAGLLARLLAGL
jgi:hypothetical protein